MRTMDAPPLTIANFQRHISDRYESADRANLEEEFADVLAWLCTLANINDVDLAKAVTTKYLSGGGPSGHK
jgi:NTP pyrophosphatase (non-canonical NTP hydrolase)